MKSMKVMSINLLCIISLIGFMSCESSTEIADELIAAENSLASKGGPKALIFDGSCDYTVTNLIAGQNTVVGTVEVTVVGGYYNITYSVINGWCISETHLDVAESPENFPMTGSGNPKNGHFEYSDSHDCVSSFTYEVPTSEGEYIAAHAVVNCTSGTIEDFAESLPETLNACTTEKGVDAVDSYFNLTVNDTALAGDYDAWCVDFESSLQIQCYDANVYSSYETLPEGIFENPDNFDLVNWIVNQDFVGEISPGQGGEYTFSDVQIAMWEIIENKNCTDTFCAYVGDFDLVRIDEIIEQATANGEGFIPECGDLISIVLVPLEDLQSVIISVPLPCGDECEETAWAEGCDFPGNNWAMYFHYMDTVKK